jgi:predicted transcriptional regulator
MVKYSFTNRRSQIMVLGLVLLLAVNIPVGATTATYEDHGPRPRTVSGCASSMPPPPDQNGERWGDWVIDCPSNESVTLTFATIKLHGNITITHSSILRLNSSSKIIQMFETAHYTFQVQENAQLHVLQNSELHLDKFIAKPTSNIEIQNARIYTNGYLNASSGVLKIKDSYIENQATSYTASLSGGVADLVLEASTTYFTGSTIVNRGGRGGPGKPGGNSNAFVYVSSGVLSQFTLDNTGGAGGWGNDPTIGNGTNGGPGGNSLVRLSTYPGYDLEISSSYLSVIGGDGGRGGNGASGYTINRGSGGDGELGGLAQLDISAKSLKIENSTVLVRGGKGGIGGTGGQSQNGNGGNGGAGGSGMGANINITLTKQFDIEDSSIQSTGGMGGDAGFFGSGSTYNGAAGSAGNGGPSSIHFVAGSFKGNNSTSLALGGPGGRGGLGAELGGSGGFGGDARFELRASDSIVNTGLGTKLSELGSEAGEGGAGGDAVGSSGNGGGQAGPEGFGGSCTTILNATNNIELKHTHLRCYSGRGGHGPTGTTGASNTTIDTLMFNATATKIEGILRGFNNNDKVIIRNSTMETSPFVIVAADQCKVIVKIWWTLSVNIPNALSNETWEISVYSGPASDGNLVATAMVEGGPNKYVTFELQSETITCKGTTINNYTVIGRNIGSHVYTSNLTIGLSNNTVRGLDVGCYRCPPPIVTITNPPTPGILMNDSLMAPCKPPDINTSNPGCFVFKGDATSGDTDNAVIDDIKVWLIRDGNETFFFKTDSNPPIVLIQRGQGLAQWSFGWELGAWNFNSSYFVYPAGEWAIMVSVHERYVNLPNQNEGLWSKTVSTNFTVVHSQPPNPSSYPPTVNAGDPVVNTIPYGKSGVEVTFKGATITPKLSQVIRIEWDYDGDNVVDWSYAPTGCSMGSDCPVPVTKHIYSKLGTYNAILCAVDVNGVKGCDTKKVQVVKGEAPTVFGVPTPLLIALTVVIVVISSFIIAALIIASLSEATKYSIMAFILIPLYTRLKKEEMLDNYTRGEIRGYIVANPGAHYSRIKRDLNLNNGTLIYHLSTLEREGFVYSHRDDYYRRFYPRGRKPRPGPNLTTVQESIIEILLDNPGLTTEDIAQKLDKSRKVTNYHLVWLRRSGLIEAKDDGRRKTYTVIYEDETEASQDGITDGLKKGISKGPSEQEEDEPSEP